MKTIMNINFLFLILIVFAAGCNPNVKDNSNQKNSKTQTKLVGIHYRYIKWFKLYPAKGEVIEVKIYQDSLYNLFLEVYDSSKRRIYGSAATMMSNVDTTGDIVKRYFFDENKKISTYVISSYVVGSTYGKTTLFFIWKDGNNWQVRTDNLNRAKIESINHGKSYGIIDYYPDQEKHIYQFANGNIIPLSEK